jgi:hypothetical protein
LRGIPIRLLGWVPLGWIPSLGSHNVELIGCRGMEKYFSLDAHSCLFALALALALSLSLSCLYSTKETLPLSFFFLFLYQSENANRKATNMQGAIVLE